jgi:hypothetical protein
MAPETLSASGCAPVAVVQAADLRHSDHSAAPRRLHLPRFRRIPVE